MTTLISPSYLATLRLDVPIYSVTVKNVSTEEEAGLSYEDGVLHISVHSFLVTHKPWSITPLDPAQFFHELELAELSKKWRAGSVNVTGSRHKAAKALIEAVG